MQALRPADENVRVRAQLLVGPLHDVVELGPGAGRGEHELRGGAGVADVLELDVGGAIGAAPPPPHARRDRERERRADERSRGADFRSRGVIF